MRLIKFICNLFPVSKHKLYLHEQSKLRERLRKTEDELASYKGLYELGQ